MFDDLEKAVALRAAPLFAPLAAEALLPVARMCSQVDLQAGDSLFAEGDLGDALYVIVTGKVSVLRGTRPVATLGPGECVGEMAALDWEPRSASVVAQAQTSLIRLDHNDLMDLLGDYPELVRALAAVLVARLRSTPR
jgi:CRP-like cAMP-binding protein